jgi:hypothetical protein
MVNTDYLVCLGVKDVDNDGKPELISSCLNSLSIYQNTSVGSSISFGTRVNKNKPVLGYYMAFGDIDGDGKPEIISPNYESSISIFKNSGITGSISFADAQNVPATGAYGLAVVDLDGDGLADMASTNNSGNGLVSVYRNTSLGGIISFAPEVNFNTSADPRGLSFGYIDDDNKPDIVVANQYGHSFAVFINTSSPGNISFNGRIEIPVSKGYPESIAIGDVDGDDKADVVVGTNNIGVGAVAVFRNTSGNGYISFATAIECNTETDWQPYLVVMNDIDGDGKPDVAVTNQMNKASLFFKIVLTRKYIYNPKVDVTTWKHTGGPGFERSEMEMGNLKLCGGNVAQKYGCTPLTQEHRILHRCLRMMECRNNDNTYRE